MPYRPIQWAKRTVEGRQTEADGSRLLNFYPIQLAAPEDSKVPVMLYSTPGLRRYIQTNGTNAVAGHAAAGVHQLLQINSVVYGKWLCGLSHQSVFFAIRVDPANGGAYQIDGDYDPYKASPDAVYTIPAANTYRNWKDSADVEPDNVIPTDQARRMVSDGRRVMWFSKDEVYGWDFGKSGGPGFITLTVPVAPDLSTLEDLDDQDWVDMEWIDGYFLLAARNGVFFHSNLDSVQFDQLDFAEAGANPDQIVGMRALSRRLYMIGTETVETWYNAGAADFAFARDNSATLNFGCVAPASIARNQFFITFIGSDGVVYALSPSGPRRISTENIEYDINQSVAKLARAFTYTEEGHHFYSLTLEYADGTKKGWCYDFTTSWWHERSQTDILCAIRWNGQQVLVGREGSAHIFDQRLDWGLIESDMAAGNDQAVAREAVSPRIFANLQRFNMRSFQIDVPQRTGGQNTDAVTIEWSDDGKVNWKGGSTSDGMAKTYRLDSGPRLRVNRLGQVREGRNMRVTTSAHRRVDMLGAYIETDVFFD